MEDDESSVTLCSTGPAVHYPVDPFYVFSLYEFQLDSRRKNPLFGGERSQVLLVVLVVLFST